MRGTEAAVWAISVCSALMAAPAAASSRPDFAAWRTQLWPDAERFGIRRETFDQAFKGLTPDLSLPDLIRAAVPNKKPRGQAEFTRRPQDYVREKSIRRLAATGRRLAVKHKATLAKIEARFGVPAAVVLAIWGRETAYGGYRLRHDAIRALATQAYVGRRHEMFRRELLFALKMLDDGVIKRQHFRASWAGAFGLTQFMPSEYEALAVDLDGDGRKDVWSVADALASAANQLKQKGWQSGQSWGYEVTMPPSVTCAEDGPLQAKPIATWQARGVRRVAGRTFASHHLALSAFLFSPGGGMGPVFLATENFLVFKRYNTSDLYALFVGHLADRIAGGGRFVRRWGRIKQLPGKQIASIQSILKREGFAISKIDGRIGPNTRSQIGRYQLRENLAVDCWPSAALLSTMHRRNTTSGLVRQ
ncbi:MAG: lytic murein transglycosylase [Hyphomicrobiaceae bacterium]